MAIGPELFDQAGDNSAGADVVSCNTGTIFYEAEAFTVNGESTLNAINPGDLIIASVSETNSGTTRATIQDVTGGISQYDVGPSAGGSESEVSYLVGAVGPGFGHFTVAGSSVPTFTSVLLTQNMVNGQPVDQTATKQLNLKLSSTVDVAAGALAGNGESFRLSWKANG